MSYTQQEQRSVRQIAIWIDHREAIMAIFSKKLGDNHGYAKRFP